ncbi:MAG: hypothetical protein QY314_00150 [Candidatus Dojkabacteria bacterium]|nr:MAG: hypothetical protein QY314_00150 [Candidatus Dojkabacteria bacterium]
MIWQEEKLNANVIVVDKPYGLPSYAVVDWYKKVFPGKVGHGGTLDPLATGKLVILTGNATKQASDFLNNTKQYEMTILLGAETSSADLEQMVEIAEAQMVFPEQSKLVQSLKTLEQHYVQEVPQYSAVKQDGQKLYDTARAGEEVALPTREVSITFEDISEVSQCTGKEISGKVGEMKETLAQNYQNLSSEWQQNFNRTLFPKYEDIGHRLAVMLEKQSEAFMQSSATFGLLTVTVTISKGGYMRSLAEDVGKLLNTTALVLNLRRTGV